MIEKTYNINGLDNHKIFVVSWKTGKEIKIKGTLHIVHGMAEHCMRYKEFARFLVNEGFIVYAHDHRGHGQSIGSDEYIGFFDNTDGWNKVVDEVHIVNQFIKQKEPDTDVYILGHSMGSFITRHYIQLYGKEVKAVILSGTGTDKGLIGVLGKWIAKAISKIKGDTHQSKFLTNMSFGSFNNAFKPNKTNYDWLSRDENQVDLYNKDEMCGFQCSARFFVDLLTGLSEIYKEANILRTPKSLPLLFISGAKDPVGDMGKGVEKLVNTYKKLEYEVDVKLFEEGRHEIINEKNKQQVYEYILNWLVKVSTR